MRGCSSVRSCWRRAAAAGAPRRPVPPTRSRRRARRPRRPCPRRRPRLRHAHESDGGRRTRPERRARHARARSCPVCRARSPSRGARTTRACSWPSRTVTCAPSTRTVTFRRRRSLPSVPCPAGTRRASSASRSRPTARSSTSTTRIPATTPTSTSTRWPARSRSRRRAGKCSSSRSRSTTTRAASSSPDPTECSTSAWATAGARTTRSTTARISPRCCRRSCASTRPRSAARRTPSRPTTRSSVAAVRGPRHGCGDCAIRGGSRSTASTGDLWIGDVGQNKYEEIDFAARGAKGINWGWSAREGFHAFRGAAPSDARDPLLELPHSDGYCAIVGGYVYRGAAIHALDGVYVFGDDCRSNLVGIVAAGGHVARATRPRPAGDAAHDLRRGPERRALRRVPPRHRVPPDRRFEPSDAGALEHHRAARGARSRAVTPPRCCRGPCSRSRG